MLDFGSINVWTITLVFIAIFQLHLSFVCSFNGEGIALLKFKERVVNDPNGALTGWNENFGENGHCSWFGIKCADGHVISLNLENLSLEGTLAPELHHLLHIKAIILRNNSFSGTIPKEIEGLKDLELLDLAYNNFRRPLLHDVRFHFTNLHNGWEKGAEHHRMLEDAPTEKGTSSDLNSPPAIGKGGNGPVFGQPPQTPKLSPPPTPSVRADTAPPPPVDNKAPPVPELPTPPVSPQKKKIIFIVVGPVVGFIVLAVAIGLCFWGAKKIRKTEPWSKGLTGQLQRAFVSGLQNLRRFELETACEDFSNVIGTCSIGTIYKGTLSNGVEISVISLAASSAKDWSKSLETQFRKKIETLSKVNHKNFINLVGYCEEQEPFTRMMVFEYAPNGSLFEHLHVREAEHLDWGMRLRVAMGMAYCLEYMHQLAPPVTHPNLSSSSVHLSDDYAAKISDFCFWNEVAAAQVQPIDLANLSSSSATLASNVHSYGLVLLEMMTGRITHTFVSNNTVDDWVLEYTSGEKPLHELVDPMLRRYDPEQVEKVSEVIRKCLHSDPQLRPTMKDVSARFKEITALNRDKAGPRLSPIWWAELEETRSVSEAESM